MYLFLTITLCPNDLRVEAEFSSGSDFFSDFFPSLRLSVEDAFNAHSH